MTLSNEQQQQLHQQFHTQYFAVWNGSEPHFSKELLSERYRHLLEGTWYGENRQQVEPERVRQLVAFTDWEHFPSM